MKKLLLSVLTVFVALSCAFTAQAGAKKKADKQTQVFRYDIEYVKTAGTGIVAVKVASYSKKPGIALNQCPKNAVHGVIFKGYAGNGTSMAALCKDPGAETAHPDYFKAFFAEGGEYNKYVSSVDTANSEFLKAFKEYKVSQVVYVNKAALSKALESAGIIKGLAAGF